MPSEAHKYRFRFEMDAPEFFHPLLNVIFQSQDVGGGGVAAIHDGQGMLARNAGAAGVIALAETGVLHQPGRGDFALGVERRIAGDLQSLDLGALVSARRIGPARARGS